MRNNGQAVEVPACQSERNEAFTRAVRAGDAKTAAALARAGHAGGCDGTAGSIVRSSTAGGTARTWFSRFMATTAVPTSSVWQSATWRPWCRRSRPAG